MVENTHPDRSTGRQVAIRIVNVASETEKAALKAWAMQLLEIRASGVPTVVKAKQAIALTRKSEVVWPSVKMLSREMKRLAWDDRGLAGRFGLGGAAIGIAVFGGQGAGIAALGTAIGVPLWVVVGSGAAFAGVLLQELTGEEKREPLTTYSVIEAEEVDPEAK